MTTRNELAELAKTRKQPFLTNESYNVIKQGLTVGLPAVGAFYATVGQLWGWPYGNEVVATILAVVTLGNVWLNILGWRYANSDAKYDGIVSVNTTDPEKDVFKLLYNKNIAAIPDQKELTLKVVDTSADEPLDDLPEAA